MAGKSANICVFPTNGCWRCFGCMTKAIYDTDGKTIGYQLPGNWLNKRSLPWTAEAFTTSCLIKIYRHMMENSSKNFMSLAAFSSGRQKRRKFSALQVSPRKIIAARIENLFSRRRKTSSALCYHNLLTISAADHKYVEPTRSGFMVLINLNGAALAVTKFAGNVGVLFLRCSKFNNWSFVTFTDCQAWVSFLALS